MDAALMKLVGPIVKFAVGSLLFFTVALGYFLTQRARLTKLQFKNRMRTITIVWLIAGIGFFFWLAKHLNP